MTNAVILGRNLPITKVCHGISRGFAPISGARAAKEAIMKTTLQTLILSAVLASPALALVPINEEPVIHDQLLQGFIGDAIVDNCPSMEARTLKALGELNELRNYALEQGYDPEVVRAFVTSKDEKKKFKAEAAEWLAAMGAEPGNPDAYCQIGEAEIAADSLIGQLLRSTK
jgi:Family of unknown function (DUF5333)